MRNYISPSELLEFIMKHGTPIVSSQLLFCPSQLAYLTSELHKKIYSDTPCEKEEK